MRHSLRAPRFVTGVPCHLWPLTNLLSGLGVTAFEILVLLGLRFRGLNVPALGAEHSKLLRRHSQNPTSHARCKNLVGTQGFRCWTSLLCSPSWAFRTAICGY